MIAIDTNVIIRFLMRDDEKQAQVVYKRFKKAAVLQEQLFVPLVVVLEIIWVLESAYDMSRADILCAISDLLQMPIFDFENSNALGLFIAAGKRTKGDLSDLLIACSAESSGCYAVLTFDKKALRLPLFEKII